MTTENPIVIHEEITILDDDDYNPGLPVPVPYYGYDHMNNYQHTTFFLNGNYFINELNEAAFAYYCQHGGPLPPSAPYPDDMEMPQEDEFYNHDYVPDYYNQQELAMHEDDDETDEADCDKCAICLNGMRKKTHSLFQSDHCIHIFHSVCMGSWMSKSSSCPVCRTLVIQ